MWGFIVALISGALMSIQGVFNTEVTKQTSLWVSSDWVQLSAFAVCVFAWLFTGRESVAALWQVDNKYTLLGGVIGAFITITVIQSMGALGPAKAACAEQWKKCEMKLSGNGILKLQRQCWLLRN